MHAKQSVWCSIRYAKQGVKQEESVITLTTCNIDNKTTVLAADRVLFDCSKHSRSYFGFDTRGLITLSQLLDFDVPSIAQVISGRIKHWKCFDAHPKDESTVYLLKMDITDINANGNLILPSTQPHRVTSESITHSKIFCMPTRVLERGFGRWVHKKCNRRIEVTQKATTWNRKLLLFFSVFLIFNFFKFNITNITQL